MWKPRSSEQSAVYEPGSQQWTPSGSVTPAPERLVVIDPAIAEEMTDFGRSVLRHTLAWAGIREMRRRPPSDTDDVSLAPSSRERKHRGSLEDRDNNVDDIQEELKKFFTDVPDIPASSSPAYVPMTGSIVAVIRPGGRASHSSNIGISERTRKDLNIVQVLPKSEQGKSKRIPKKR